VAHTHSAHSAYRGPATEPNRPGPARPTTSEAGPWGATVAPSARIARTVRCAQSVCRGTVEAGSPAANRQPCYARGADPCYRASPGTTWSEAQTLDGPRPGPHGAQRVAMARHVAWAEAVGDRTARGKVSTGCIHGPRRTCMTRSKAIDSSEEGGRQRCGAHRRGRRPCSSMAVKVSVLRFGEQLQGLVKLLDLRMG
jgi:hypothetical protein